jgi:7,8-dihydro-6-hydroxymethylpterin dimethyltransferase
MRRRLRSGPIKPLLKSWEKSKPPLGWPRSTDSLCPKCVPEIRQQILDGHLPVDVLMNEKVGEIKAQIVEKRRQDLDGEGLPEARALRRPDVDRHGILEASGRGFPRPRHQGPPTRSCIITERSTVKYGRGAVLTVDLTNRCNMMCDPCFMDANQVGYVHELTWEEIKTVLDNAITVKPKRQMSVQFSGGEPTLSPYFPGCGSLRAQSRIQQRAGRHQRNRIRQEF